MHTYIHTHIHIYIHTENNFNKYIPVLEAFHYLRQIMVGIFTGVIVQIILQDIL